MRGINQKWKADNPSISNINALQLAVKAAKDTIGPSGLVSTLLVVCIVPRIQINPNELHKNLICMKSIHDAINDISVISYRITISTASRSNVPAAEDREFSIGEEVLMYNEKAVGKWFGPYAVKNIDKKKFTFTTADRSIRVFIDKLKPYFDVTHSDNSISHQFIFF